MFTGKGSAKAWIIFILVILIAFGLLYYFRNLYVPPSERPPEVTEAVPGKGFGEDLSPREKKKADSSAYNEALLYGSASDCEEIQFNEELKKECLDNFNFAAALKTNNEKICEAIFDEAMKQDCFDKVYYAAATDGLDLELCKKIEKDSLRQSCLDKIQSLLGRRAESEEDCMGIVNPNLKKDCLDNFHLSKSVAELNIDSCATISSSSLRSRCESTITQNLKVQEVAKAEATAKTKTTAEVLSGCDQLEASLAQRCKDNSNYKLALEKKDLAYCDRIVDAEKKQDCREEQGENLDRYYFQLALSRRDNSYCTKISDTGTRTVCQNTIQ